nr:MAG TPA_asm: adenine specific DNA methyltransferase [Caudoviricetes sp.]
MRKEVIGKQTLYCGNSLELLDLLQDGAYGLVLTDPPYMINTKSDGTGKIDPWGDYMNAAVFYAEWIGKARQKLKDDGALMSFLNWRSVATFTKASCLLGWPMESLVVWNKKYLGTNMRGFRPMYEMIALFTQPGFKLENRSLGDIVEEPRLTRKPNHPAEKPVALLEFLLREAKKDNVLDVFMGSGTTLVACEKLGLYGTGFEINEKYFDAACRRVEEVACTR